MNRPCEEILKAIASGKRFDVKLCNPTKCFMAEQYKKEVFEGYEDKAPEGGYCGMGK